MASNSIQKRGFEMKVAYIRTSTEDQNLDRQIHAVKAEAVDRIFSEQLSGKDTNRPEFQKMMNYVRPGDEVVVVSLDRLGRDYSDIKETVRLLQEKSVQLHVLDAPFLRFNTGNVTLDKAMGDMFISLLGYISQNEREKMLERQRQGIEQAKLRGVYTGRPIKYHVQAKDPKDKLVFLNVRHQLNEARPIRWIARENGISKSTVYEIKKRVMSGAGIDG